MLASVDLLYLVCKSMQPLQKHVSYPLRLQPNICDWLFRYVWLPMWVMDGRFRPRYSAEAVQTIRQTIPRPTAAQGANLLASAPDDANPKHKYLAEMFVLKVCIISTIFQERFANRFTCHVFCKWAPALYENAYLVPTSAQSLAQGLPDLGLCLQKECLMSDWGEASESQLENELPGTWLEP